MNQATNKTQEGQMGQIVPEISTRGVIGNRWDHASNASHTSPNAEGAAGASGLPPIERGQIPPLDWSIPAWLEPFNRAELAYLAERQDSRCRELRNTITRLREQLRKETGE